MFESLEVKIRKQNLKKVKQLNVLEPSSDSECSEYGQEEQSLSDIDIELQERQKNFNRIMAMPSDPSDNEFFIKKDDSLHTPPSFIRKLKNQLQLSYEKIRLQQDSHTKEIISIRQIHSRQKQFLEMENNKLKLQLSRQKKIKQSISAIRNQRNCLLEINEMLEKRCKDHESSNQQLEFQIQSLSQQIRTLQQADHQNSLDPAKISELTKRIENLQEDRNHWKNRCHRKEQAYEKQEREIKLLKSQVERQRNNSYKEIEKITSQYQMKVECLQREIQNLNKRNKYLEEVFLEKISEITKLQATFLTNTTNRASSSYQDTLNLQEESPIKKPHVHDGDIIRKNRAQSSWQHVNNPERQKAKQQENIAEKMNKKLKQKLQYANQKIIQLLEDKIRNQKKIVELNKRVSLGKV